MRLLGGRQNPVEEQHAVSTARTKRQESRTSFRRIPTAKDYRSDDDSTDEHDGRYNVGEDYYDDQDRYLSGVKPAFLWSSHEDESSLPAQWRSQSFEEESIKQSPSAEDRDWFPEVDSLDDDCLREPLPSLMDRDVSDSDQELKNVKQGKNRAKAKGKGKSSKRRMSSKAKKAAITAAVTGTAAVGTAAALKQSKTSPTLKNKKSTSAPATEAKTSKNKNSKENENKAAGKHPSSASPSVTTTEQLAVDDKKNAVKKKMSSPISPTQTTEQNDKYMISALSPTTSEPAVADAKKEKARAGPFKRFWKRDKTKEKACTSKRKKKNKASEPSSKEVSEQEKLAAGGVVAVAEAAAAAVSNSPEAAADAESDQGVFSPFQNVCMPIEPEALAAEEVRQANTKIMSSAREGGNEDVGPVEALAAASEQPQEADFCDAAGTSLYETVKCVDTAICINGLSFLDENEAKAGNASMMVADGFELDGEMDADQMAALMRRRRKFTPVTITSIEIPTSPTDDSEMAHNHTLTMDDSASSISLSAVYDQLLPTGEKKKKNLIFGKRRREKSFERSS